MEITLTKRELAALAISVVHQRELLQIVRTCIIRSVFCVRLVT